jgi:hypothetical protein
MALDLPPERPRDFIRDPEFLSLLDKLQENLRASEAATNFELRPTGSSQFVLEWKQNTTKSSGADFEAGYFCVDGMSLSLFAHAHAPTSARIEVVPLGEKSLLQFMEESPAQRASADLETLSLANLTAAFERVVGKGLPEWAEGLEQNERGALLFDATRLPARLEIPEGAFLSDGQKQLLATLMDVGEELLLLATAQGDSREIGRKFSSSAYKETYQSVCDQAHIAYALASVRGTLSDDWMEEVRRVHPILHSMLQEGSAAAESAAVERDSFELIVAFAKIRAIIEEVPMRIVGSEAGHNTWNDFAVLSPLEIMFDSDNSVRCVIGNPFERLNARP